MLHILDLALYVDMYASSFLCWTDDATIFPGRSRDERLVGLYRRYLQWCTTNSFWGSISTWRYWKMFLFKHVLHDFLWSIQGSETTSEEFPMVPGPELSCFNQGLFKRIQAVTHRLVKKNWTVQLPECWSTLHKRFLVRSIATIPPMFTGEVVKKVKHVKLYKLGFSRVPLKQIGSQLLYLIFPCCVFINFSNLMATW